MSENLGKFLEQAINDYSGLINSVIHRGGYNLIAPHMLSFEDCFQVGLIGAALGLKNSHSSPPVIKYLATCIHNAIRQELSTIRLQHKRGVRDYFLQWRDDMGFVQTLYEDGQKQRPDRKYTYRERIATCGLPAPLHLQARSPFWFCHVRHCPLCQYRRAERWGRRIYRSLSQSLRDYPEDRLSLLTLLGQEIAVTRLRQALVVMGQGWDFFRKEIYTHGIKGYIRFTKTIWVNETQVRPSYYGLLLGQPSPLHQKVWALWWQKSLQRATELPLEAHQITSASSVTIRQCEQREAMEFLREPLLKSEDLNEHGNKFAKMVPQVWGKYGTTTGGALKWYAREVREGLQEIKTQGSPQKISEGAESE